jgi:hypothetical protein
LWDRSSPQAWQRACSARDRLSAAPGVSFDPGTGGKNTIGIGDQKPGGAYANASKGNTALAVNLGLSPKGTVATANNSGTGNNVFALEGASVVTDGAKGSIKPNNNNVGTVFGGTVLAGGQGNSIVNGGGLITALDGQSENQTSVSFCGTRVTAQSAHIVPGKVPGGLC